MENSPRKSSSWRSDFIDLLFGFPSYSSLNLVPTRKIFTERKRKAECLTAQQVNYFTNGKFETIYNILPKPRIDGAYDTKMNLGSYSPSLTVDLAQMIERGMRKINCMKYPNKIIDSMNSEKITSRFNNIENLMYTKMKENFAALGNITKSGLRKQFLAKTVEQKPLINNHSKEAIAITTTESKECPNMEKPRVVRALRKCTNIERNRGRGRGRIQLRKSGVSQFKHKKERSKQNLHCNIQDDIDAWSEDLQDFPEMPTGDCEHFTSPTNSHVQPDKTIPRYQTTDSDYPTLQQTFSSNNQPKSIKKIPKNNNDSPVSSPKDYVPLTCNYRPRYQSESSIDSEESYCIVFQDDSDSDSDYESSSGDEESSSGDGESSSGDEESEDDEKDDEPNQKVRFVVKPKIHMMIHWEFAYRTARKGPWEQFARDRDRFRCRINCINTLLKPILSLQHREQIYQSRFATHD